MNFEDARHRSLCASKPHRPFSFLKKKKKKKIFYSKKKKKKNILRRKKKCVLRFESYKREMKSGLIVYKKIALRYFAIAPFVNIIASDRSS